MAFRMTVRNVFNFSNGQTVLAGIVEGHEGFIKKGLYGLYQNESLLRQITLEGEMIPRVVGERGVYRAVMSIEAVGLLSGPPKNLLILTVLGDGIA